MSRSKLVVGALVGLTVMALVAAFLIPIGTGAIVDDRTITQTTAETETDSLTSTLNVTVDSVTTDTEATLTISAGEDSDTQTISESGTETFTVNGDEIDATLDDAGDGEATVTYEIPRDAGWSDGASALWGILDVMIILAVFLLFVGIALKVS